MDADDRAADGRTARWAHRRPQLLAAATEYVLDNGVADLTLRPLAAGIGVTITTVVRQFGSKDELIEEVTRAINQQLLDDLRHDPELADRPPIETLRTLWHRWLTPAQARQFRLMFELYGLALQNPRQYRWFTESVVRDWLPPIEQALARAGVQPARARTLATLVLALLRGLHLDLVVTHDTARIDAAFEIAVTTLAAAVGANQ
ncbi:MAG TPA: TetR/AcrR family transcriptional regulator [Rugosimonospora sp.]|nr:TetR/AcrR family transcriptional regulator [Rugosimonospora sp.]